MQCRIRVGIESLFAVSVSPGLSMNSTILAALS
jgi:hypothetical protein